MDITKVTIERADSYIRFIDLCMSDGTITKEYGNQIIDGQDWEACEYLMEKWEKGELLK
jgi:hypothetical protein